MKQDKFCNTNVFDSNFIVFDVFLGWNKQFIST
jgi:hypothetical protein